MNVAVIGFDVLNISIFIRLWSSNLCRLFFFFLYDLLPLNYNHVNLEHTFIFQYGKRTRQSWLCLGQIRIRNKLTVAFRKKRC